MLPLQTRSWAVSCASITFLLSTRLVVRQSFVPAHGTTTQAIGRERITAAAGELLYPPPLNALR